MKYYIKCGLAIRLENSWFLPGTVDLQVGAVLADEATDIHCELPEQKHRIGQDMIKALSQALPEQFSAR